jgi:hypothetical protein
MLEKRFYAVPPQAFTANGTVDGVVTIAGNACGLFKVKQKVYLSATGLTNLYLEIKEIDSEDNIQVGPIPGTLNVNNSPNIKSQNTGISARTDISAYTVALGAAIFADEQKRPSIDMVEIARAVYSEEPTCAQRGILVDDCGDTFGTNNPFPVAFDGTISIGDVSIVEGGNTMGVNPDGSINVNLVNSTDVPGLLLFHSDISSVVSGVETTIITVTAPSGGFRLEKIDASGENVALYRVYVNGVEIYDKRSWWTAFNVSFDFESFENGYLLTAGQVLTVTCYHTRPYTANFEATVLVLAT